MLKRIISISFITFSSVFTQHLTFSDSLCFGEIGSENTPENFLLKYMGYHPAYVNGFPKDTLKSNSNNGYALKQRYPMITSPPPLCNYIFKIEKKSNVEISIINENKEKEYQLFCDSLDFGFYKLFFSEALFLKNDSTLSLIRKLNPKVYFRINNRLYEKTIFRNSLTLQKSEADNFNEE